MNVIDQFEHEVRTVVRRGSKSVEFESPIKEVAAHFADLIQEQLSAGATRSEAETIAKKRIGLPLNIGLQILNTPSRVSKGLRLQKIAIIGMVLMAFEYEVIEYCALRHWQGLALSAFAYACFALYVYVVIQFGRGMIMAKKVLWLPIVAAIPTSILIFGIGHELLSPLVEQYNQNVFRFRPVELVPDNSIMRTLSVGVMFAERLFGFFSIIALFSFAIGRMWLTRLSWFQLTRG